jgi:uncharacterized protein YggT (Ycf19 family)
VKARQEIADFLGALLTVYVIVIIAWVLISFVFAMGVRVPYSRWSNAVLDFLRDTANPWLSIFRRLPLRVSGFVPCIEHGRFRSRSFHRALARMGIRSAWLAQYRDVLTGQSAYSGPG